MPQINFLHGGQQPGRRPRRFGRGLPDPTVHHPPGAMYVLGLAGLFAGIFSNLWQMFTTMSAFWLLFYGAKSVLVLSFADFGNVVFYICLFIAFSFQYALMMLVFRLDSIWKKHMVGGGFGKKHSRGRVQTLAVEMVQQVTLVLIWALLGFVVDTIGDYTFIGSLTTRLDAFSQVFVIFMYAVALYALSTVALVRAIEYLWAGEAVADKLAQDRAKRRLPLPKP